jgi:hypothetical protein
LPLLVEENVGWLDVSVDNILFSQVAKGVKDLCGEELGKFSI